MANLRVTDTQGYLLYREVEPVQPYPRIDPQQPPDEKLRNREDSRPKKDEPARRRFVAMRHLIEGLKDGGTIVRVDYATLVRDLGLIGLTLIEGELFDLLRSRRVLTEGLMHLNRQLHDMPVTMDPHFALPLAEERGLLPCFVPGLCEVVLESRPLELLPGQEGPLLLEALAAEGYYRCVAHQVQLECRPLIRFQYDSAIELKIQLLVGAGEMDDAGRRAILYRRSPGVFALYTDKRINLSI